MPLGASPALKVKITKAYQEYGEFMCESESLRADRLVITDKLKNLKAYLAQMRKKLTAFRSVRKRSSDGLESKMFSVLKSINVELTSYHGGSLNGKDIKKVMDNASFVFDLFKQILKEGKKAGLPDDFDSMIELMCKKYKSAFLLWDGAFSFAQKVNPTFHDRLIFAQYVSAIVDAHQDVGCNITHKVHLMLHHVFWQMGQIKDGLGGLS